MYVCTPLYVPSNLGETELHIGISPGIGNMLNPCDLMMDNKLVDKKYEFVGFTCFIWTETVKAAQRGIIKKSRELEKHLKYPIQSDRFYFLPLFDNVGYKLTVTHKKNHERPVIRVAYYPNDPKRTWNCEIYTSSLVQLQEALFDHERNLLKKRLQALDQQRAKKG
ncbi:MAG: hypothetical protein K2P26_12575 [Oscillospiraceae bacterium]|nr:hypothetical protein [Oscillospiraceae bacterium]